MVDEAAVVEEQEVSNDTSVNEEHPHVDLSSEDHGTVIGTKIVSLTHIVEPGFRLRDAERDSEEYQALLDSIKQKGVITPITVRPITITDPTGEKQERYELITGTQRYNCSLDAGLETIPVLIKEMSDQEAKETQIVENLRRVHQKPAQVGQMLINMLNSDPNLTIALLSRRLSTTVGYIQDRLKLNKLKPEIQQIVDEGNMPLSNAVMLARFPEDQQDALLQAAINDPVEEFLPAAREQFKNLKKAQREANDAPQEFTPTPKARKKGDLVQEFEVLTGAAEGESALLNQFSDLSADQAATVLSWVLCLDEASISEARDKWESRQRQAEERKAALAAERERKKAEQAAQL